VKKTTTKHTGNNFVAPNRNFILDLTPQKSSEIPPNLGQNQDWHISLQNPTTADK